MPIGPEIGRILLRTGGVKMLSKLVEIVWKLYFDRNTPRFLLLVLSINGSSVRKRNTSFAILFSPLDLHYCIAYVRARVFFFFTVVGTSYFKNFPPIFFLFYVICVQYNFMKFKNTWNFFPLIYSSISIVSIHRDIFLQIIRYTGMFVPTLSLRPIRFLTIKIYFW